MLKYYVYNDQQPEIKITFWNQDWKNLDYFIIQSAMS